MSYPLINAATLNDSGAGNRISLPPIQSLTPVVFGGAQIVEGTPVQPGSAVSLTPNSLSAVLFGDTVVILGMPPSAVVLPAAAGVRPASFGTPSVRSSLVLGSPQSLRPIIVGRPMMAMALHAQVLQPVSFGTPGQAAVLPAQPLGYAQFGRPALAMRLPAAGTSAPKPRFGQPRVSLGSLLLGAGSLEAGIFGRPGPVGARLRAYTLTGVRFGRPSVLGDSSTC